MIGILLNNNKIRDIFLVLVFFIGICLFANEYEIEDPSPS